MASLLERVSTLVSANLNYLVTKALKANSVAVVDEYIRRVEDNLEALEDAAATVGGEARGLRRKYEETRTKLNELDQSIDTLLQQGRTDLARAAQSRYNTLERTMQTYERQALAQEAEFQTLLDSESETGDPPGGSAAGTHRAASHARPGQVQRTDAQGCQRRGRSHPARRGHRRDAR